MPPNRIRTEQEINGRRGRPITDQDAHEINRVEELSYDLKIHEVMSKNLHTASPDISLSDVLKILRVNRISGVPVVEDEKLIGVISIEDIVRALQNNDLTETVGQYMTRELVTVSNFESIVKAMQTFAEKHVGRLPVVNE